MRGMGNMLTNIPGVSITTPQSAFNASTGMRGLADTTSTATPTTTTDVSGQVTSFTTDLTTFMQAHPIGALAIGFLLLRGFK